VHRSAAACRVQRWNRRGGRGGRGCSLPRAHATREGGGGVPPVDPRAAAAPRPEWQPVGAAPGVCALFVAAVIPKSDGPLFQCSRYFPRPGGQSPTSGPFAAPPLVLATPLPTRCQRPVGCCCLELLRAFAAAHHHRWLAEVRANGTLPAPRGPPPPAFCSSVGDPRPPLVLSAAYRSPLLSRDVCS